MTSIEINEKLAKIANGEDIYVDEEFDENKEEF